MCGRVRIEAPTGSHWLSATSALSSGLFRTAPLSTRNGS